MRARWLWSLPALALLGIGACEARSRDSARRFEAACRAISTGTSIAIAEGPLRDVGARYTGGRVLPLPITRDWGRGRRVFGHQWCSVDVDGAGVVLGSKYSVGTDLETKWMMHPRVARTFAFVRPLIE
jgi:hypothetical protein